MRAWRATDILTARERTEVLRLLLEGDTQLGREAIDEQRRRVVIHGGSAEHWLSLSGDDVLGYAQLNDSVSGAVVELAGGGFDPDLLESVLSKHSSVSWWLRGNGDLPEGGRQVRSLNFMVGPLPSDLVPVPSQLAVSTFDAERDRDEWLALNNAAFALHPEQGLWTSHELERRTAERWFDPSGFFLLRDHNALVASCWTKIHELHPERLGEIYVICVAPQAQGKGYGSLILRLGLQSLRHRGAGLGGLYVESDNTAAISLYDSIGFRTVRIDHLVTFSREVAPSPR
jgi:mycothiol synthase